MRHVFVLTSVVWWLAGCGDASPQGGKVVALGAVIDQSGSIARPAWRDAAFLAVEHANRGIELAGGFLDLRFALEFSDATNNAAVALRRGFELVRDNGVKALVTDTDGDALALNATHYDSDPSNDLGVPILCMACTSPNLGNPVAIHPDPALQRAERDLLGWAFRTTADSNPEAVALLGVARALGRNGDLNADGVWKISAYVSDDEVGNSFFEGLQRARDRSFPLINPDGTLRRDGLRLEVVRHPPDVDANSYLWSVDLDKLTDDRNEDPFVNPGEDCPVGTSCPGLVADGFPDAIIVATFPLYAAAITKVYTQAQVSIPLVHSHSWRHDTTLLKLITTPIEGQSGISHAVLDNCATSGAIFRGAMLGSSGKEPGLWDAHTYDAVMSLLMATLVAARDHALPDPSLVTGDQLREGLHKIDVKTPGAVKIFAGPEEFAKAVQAVRAGENIDYDGPSGPIDFDQNGNVRNNFVKFVVRGHRFLDELTYGCVADPDTCATQTGACKP